MDVKKAIFIFLVFVLNASVNHPHSLVIDNIQSGDAEYPLRFLVLGDNYHISSTFLRIMNYIDNNLSDSVHFAFHVGDFAASGHLEGYNNHLAVIDSLSFPILHAVGNHEVNHEDGLDNFNEIFGPPDYHFDFMNCRFIAIQNPHPSDVPDISGEYIRYEFTPSQLLWYEDLISDWEGAIFVFMHAPPYHRGHIIAGTVGGPGYNPVGPDDSGSNEFIRLNRDHAVSMVFSGHLHAYDRYHPDNATYGNTVYFITGGAGQRLIPWPYTVPYGGSFHHFIIIEVSEAGVIDGRVYILDDEVIEHNPDYDFRYYTPNYGISETKLLSDAKMNTFVRSEEIAVEIFAERTQTARIELFDVNGRQLDNVSVRLNKGVNHLALVKPEGSGVYIVKARIDDKILTGKVKIVQ